MTRLNQIIAIEKGTKSAAQKAITDAYQLLQKSAPLTGISRTYRPKDDEGDRLPSESTRVQYTATRATSDARVAVARLIDVVATKEETNTRARADVIVDGVTIWTDVPAVTLLFLERQLTDLATFVAAIPRLDPTERWVWDGNAAAYASEPTETTRTKKIPRNHVLAEATDKHPAQVQVYMEDVVVGYWRTTKFSGAMPATEVDALLERVRELHAAVKQAREAANVTEVSDVFGLGGRIMDYVFSGE